MIVSNAVKLVFFRGRQYGDIGSFLDHSAFSQGELLILLKDGYSVSAEQPDIDRGRYGDNGCTPAATMGTVPWGSCWQKK